MFNNRQIGKTLVTRTQGTSEYSFYQDCKNVTSREGVALKWFDTACQLACVRGFPGGGPHVLHSPLSSAKQVMVGGEGNVAPTQCFCTAACSLYITAAEKSCIHVSVQVIVEDTPTPFCTGCDPWRCLGTSQCTLATAVH